MEIKIKSSLCNSTDKEANIKEIKGTLKDKIIKYYEDDIAVEIILDKMVSLSRISSEYEIRLNFMLNQNTRGSYIIKDINQVLDLEITTNKLVITDGQILIDYVLNINDEEFKFKLDYEVII